VTVRRAGERVLQRMIDDPHLKEWFLAEVLPLEHFLLSIIRRSTPSGEEPRDLLHDVYERALIGAKRGLPIHTRAYVFTVTRNLLITRAKRSKVVPFDLYADFDINFGGTANARDDLTPERYAEARAELQRVIEALAVLPPRCREAVQLRKLEGLSTREIADRQGITVAGVERQLTLGMRALADFLGQLPERRQPRYGRQRLGHEGRARD